MPDSGGSGNPGSQSSSQSAPTDDGQCGLYPNGMGIVNSYELEPGVCILPLAVQPPTDLDSLKTFSPIVKLQLHAPYRRRRVHYDAVKTNNPPIMPAPQDSGLFIFCGGTVTFKTVVNATFSNFDWAVDYNCEFVENCVSRNQDGFVLGAPPWTYSTTIANQSQAAGQPPVGAVSKAGADAVIGYNQGQSLGYIQGQQYSSLATGNWAYSSCSFYSGAFFNGNIINS